MVLMQTVFSQIQKPRSCHAGKKESELYKNEFSKKDPQKEW
jgi:hypothetical protein